MAKLAAGKLKTTINKKSFIGAHVRAHAQEDAHDDGSNR
jgi:hypothetical protein